VRRRLTRPSGRLLHNEQFAPFMAVSWRREHHIFMLACAGLRGRNRGGSDARCFAASHLAVDATLSRLEKNGETPVTRFGHWAVTTGVKPDSSPIGSCDMTVPLSEQGTGRPRVFLRQAQNKLALRRTFQVRHGIKSLRLPGGTASNSRSLRFRLR